MVQRHADAAAFALSREGGCLPHSVGEGSEMTVVAAGVRGPKAVCVTSMERGLADCFQSRSLSWDPRFAQRGLEVFMSQRGLA